MRTFLDKKMRQQITLIKWILIPLLGCLHLSGRSNPERKFDSIARVIERVSFSHASKARLMLEQLYQMASRQPENPSDITQCLYLESIINYSQGAYDSAMIARIQERIDFFKDKSYPFETALLNYSKGLNYMAKNDFSEAFPVVLHASEQFKALNNERFVTKTLLLSGTICSHIRSFNLARNYYHQALSQARPDQLEYYLICANIYFIDSYNPENLAASIDSLELLMPLIGQFQDSGRMVAAYLNLGACYSENGDEKQAYHCYEVALRLSQSLDNPRLTFALYQNLGFYYESIGDLGNAKKWYSEARKTALLDGNLEHLAYACLGISTVYEKKGNIDSAYIYLQDYNRLYNKIINNSKSIETYQSYVSVVLESSKKEVKIKEQELALKNRRFVVVLVLAIAAILLILLLLVIIRQKRLQQLLLKENLESKMREITSSSILLSSKNSILQQISKLTKQFPENERTVDEIHHIINSNLNVEQDWDNFMLHFEKVHPNFFARLQAHCSDLTKNNLRLCAYFRIGVSNKEIAQILNISPESIKVNRHRLKKKLGLGEEESLDEFLRTI